MGDETYPLAHLAHLVRRVDSVGGSIRCRKWTGNDESRRNHNGKVPLDQSPLTMCLSWKKSPRDPVNLIGTFELNLEGLLEEGYIRLETNSDKEVRLRFYHGWDNTIYIQTRSKEPGLEIGTMV